MYNVNRNFTNIIHNKSIPPNCAVLINHWPFEPLLKINNNYENESVLKYFFLINKQTKYFHNNYRPDTLILIYFNIDIFQFVLGTNQMNTSFICN